MVGRQESTWLHIFNFQPLIIVGHFHSITQKVICQELFWRIFSAYSNKLPIATTKLFNSAADSWRLLCRVSFLDDIPCSNVPYYYSPFFRFRTVSRSEKQCRILLTAITTHQGSWNKIYLLLFLTFISCFGTLAHAFHPYNVEKILNNWTEQIYALHTCFDK